MVYSAACFGGGRGASGDLTIRVELAGGLKELKSRQRSIAEALKDNALAQVESITIDSGHVTLKDWIWLRSKREKLSALRRFEIRESVLSVVDLPPLSALEAKKRGWAYGKRAKVDSAKTFFPKSLEALRLAKVQNVGALAFFRNRNLKSVILPDVQQIGDFAFAHCDKVCNALRKPKPFDENAPYDAYDETDDTEDNARNIRLPKQNG